MKALRVSICVMLIVGVLAMSLSVFAVDLTDRVVAQEYLWAYYIYQFLHSIGIDVTYQGILQYTDEVQDTIIDWVIEYIADLIEADSQPSNYTIAQWIAPWQADYDYWGNLQFNSTMLEDMQDFATWLKSKLSLINDTEVVINPVYSINGTYTLFKYNAWYDASYVNSGSEYMGYLAMEYQTGVAWEANQALGYVVCGIEDYYGAGYTRYVAVNIAYSVPSTSVGRTFSTYGLVNDGSKEMIASSGVPQQSSWKTTVQGLYSYNTNYAFHEDSNHDFYVPNGTYFIGTLNQFNDFLINLEVEEVGDIKVVTYNVVLPIESPDYAQGDGVTIIDGVPNYQVINIDNVTVDNLPAVITQRNIPDIGNDEENPGFSVPWQAVNGLIQYVAAPAGAIMAIVNEAPVEGVIMLYALIGGIIIFGMIRIMREH